MEQASSADRLTSTCASGLSKALFGSGRRASATLGARSPCGPRVTALGTLAASHANRAPDQHRNRHDEERGRPDG